MSKHLPLFKADCALSYSAGDYNQMDVKLTLSCTQLEAEIIENALAMYISNESMLSGLDSPARQLANKLLTDLRLYRYPQLKG